MENASKALIMAGEILIGVLIIGILVYGYLNISSLNKTEQEAIKTEQLSAFNKEYESYNRKLIRGVDVISVMNKAIDNNKKYEEDDYYTINVQFKMAEPMVFQKDGKTSSTITFDINRNYDMNDFYLIKNNTDAFTDFKRRIFDCKEVRYNKNGRINYMRFEERRMTQNGYINGIM